MLKKPLVVILIAIVLLGIVAIVIWGYGRHQEAELERHYIEVYEQAIWLLRQDAAEEALVLLEAHFKPILATDVLAAWPELMVQAALGARRYGHLEHFIRQYPQVLLENESVALWWARTEMHRRPWQTMDELVGNWAVVERQQPNRWALLEADHCILNGEVERALELLECWISTGHEEVNRQLRLALLAGDDTAAVSAALETAYAAEPRSPDLRATAGQYFERSGQLASARREYIAAYLLAPENPFHADQLARFYLRTLALPQAIETWRQSYLATSDLRAWWNVWFWERVTQPRGELLEPAAGDWWGNLTYTLAETPDAQFLPEELYVSESHPLLLDDEAYHWLQVLESIRRGEDARALYTLERMKFAAESQNVDLHCLLLAVFDWRVRGTWPRGVVLQRGQLNHRFFSFLEQYRPPVAKEDELATDAVGVLLASDVGPAALLMAHGWLGAAERLLPDGLGAYDFAGQDATNWLPFAYCKLQARLNGAAAGLEACGDFVEDFAVRGLAAELRISMGEVEAGVAELAEVSLLEGPAGYRASYLYALAMLERQDFQALDEALDARDDLRRSVSGQELRARAANLQGNVEEALGIYESLGAESLEGCVFRYRAALEAGDLTGARELVELLIQQAPNEPVFNEWMRQLDESDE